MNISACLIKIPLRDSSEEDFDVTRTKLIIGFAMKNKVILSEVEIKFEGQVFTKMYQPNIFFPGKFESLS